MVVVVLNVDAYSLLTSVSGQQGEMVTQVAVGSALRRSISSDAVVAHVSDAEFLIADVVDPAGASSMVERIRTAMADTAWRLTLSIGVVSTPLPPLRQSAADGAIAELVAIATTAMREACRAGGDAVRYEVNPRLSTVGGRG